MARIAAILAVFGSPLALMGAMGILDDVLVTLAGMGAQLVALLASL